MVWPTYDDTWSFEALKATKADHVVYVGEDLGGCCATDGFFEYLGEHFVVVYADNVPQWMGLHDRLWIYRRK